MATRVTKLFLQDAGARSSTGGDKRVSKLVTLRKAQVGEEKPQKVQKQQLKQKPRKSAKKATGTKKTQERFLAAAERELATADRTRENVRKLKAKPTPKAQRLMAQVMETMIFLVSSGKPSDGVCMEKLSLRHWRSVELCCGRRRHQGGRVGKP